MLLIGELLVADSASSMRIPAGSSSSSSSSSSDSGSSGGDGSSTASSSSGESSFRRKNSGKQTHHHSTTSTTTTSAAHQSSLPVAWSESGEHRADSREWRQKAGAFTPPWKSPITVQPARAWRGTACYPGSELHDCPYPKLCFHNSTCTFWKTGEFLESSVISSSIKPLGSRKPANTTKAARSNSLARGMKTRLQKLCPKFDGGEFVRGKWKKACAYPWLSAREFRSRVAGKHIAIIGDSMLRQLFMRMVWHAR